jgi:hypothetical protein
MNHSKTYYCYILFLVTCIIFANPSDNALLQKGWSSLVKDNENQAFGYFWQAFEKAKKEKNTEDKAEALLYLGICQSLSEYKKLSKTNPESAKNGRNRCLQLISTIYSRQKKYKEAIKLSRNVISELKDKDDTTGTLGLAYNSLSMLYEVQKQNDSAIYYLNKAVQEFENTKNVAYLPNVYIKIGDWAKKKNQKEKSYSFYNKAYVLANSSENKQAQVLSLVALGKWNFELNKKNTDAKDYLVRAKKIATSLSDKTFEIKTIDALIELSKKEGDYLTVSRLQAEAIKLKDAYYSLEREQIAKNLEVQFEVSEKDRKLELVSKEKEVSRLTNFLLISLVLLLLIVFSILYFFLKRINKRDKLLLKTKEELVTALEEQKKLKEKQFENDMEHKESQLSAITSNTNSQLTKMVNSHLAQDTNWNDFETYFESVNKNFYTKLKNKYPDIGSNDLKICALIKLNLSIKEMASILNISPDSVKTARYRLRKKLQLNTEENLTEFILSI